MPPLLYVMTVCIRLWPTVPISSCEAKNTPGNPSTAWKSANGSIPLKIHSYSSVDEESGDNCTGALLLVEWEWYGVCVNKECEMALYYLITIVFLRHYDSLKEWTSVMLTTCTSCKYVTIIIQNQRYKGVCNYIIIPFGALGSLLVCHDNSTVTPVE